MSGLGDIKPIISSHNKKMHILLTGAGSFIGLTVTRELAKAGFRVTATYRGEETSAINTLKLRYSNNESTSATEVAVPLPWKCGVSRAPDHGVRYVAAKK